ncbi:DUF2508 family protein [Natranaerobius trueperi]|nr:DUF2508 family protein [Natranaerobius trueperi]
MHISEIIDKVKLIKKKLVLYIMKVYRYLDFEDGTKELNPEEKLLLELQKTKKEIKDAENYFNNVTDPRLIEHAAYLRKANEKKFRYLLELAKRYGLRSYVNENYKHNLSNEYININKE